MLAKIDEKLDILIFELNSDELFKVLVSNPEIICDVANMLLVALEKKIKKQLESEIQFKNCFSFT